MQRKSRLKAAKPYQRVHPPLIDAGTPQPDELFNSRRRLAGRHRPETDPLFAVWILLDDIPVSYLELARVADTASQ